MARVYLPNSKQFKEINEYLKMIGVAINAIPEFAPDGFGLGGNVSTVVSANDITATGWYRTEKDVPNTYWWLIQHIQYTDDRAVQRGYSCNDPNHPIIYRTKASATWSEWEYDNPPMVLDVEYRTTERIKGKAVYKKNISNVIHYRLEDETEWKPYSRVVGAAPAGFGLGGNVVDVSSANDITATGWYRSDSNTPNTYWWYIMHIQHWSGDAEQIAFSYNDPTKPMTIRVKLDNVWGEWEYINPPMVAGVEYRTTERFNKKVVYAQLVNFGALPNNTSKTVAYMSSGSTGAISLIGMLSDGVAISAGVNKDLNQSSSSTITLNNTKYNVVIKTDADFSSLSAYVLVKYTKD